MFGKGGPQGLPVVMIAGQQVQPHAGLLQRRQQRPQGGVFLRPPFCHQVAGDPEHLRHRGLRQHALHGPGQHGIGIHPPGQQITRAADMQVTELSDQHFRLLERSFEPTRMLTRGAWAEECAHQTSWGFG